jgi:hypothetical protein
LTGKEIPKTIEKRPNKEDPTYKKEWAMFRKTQSQVLAEGFGQ